MIYAIGDIHGQARKLRELLSKLPLQSDDQLVFVGDYIDRGPDSAGVIDQLLELQTQRPDTVFLCGNHEQMMMLARTRFDPTWRSDAQPLSFNIASLWFAEGGDATLGSYKDRYDGTEARWWELIPEAHWEFVAATALEYVTPHYHFVHAGLIPAGFDWPDDPLQGDARLWIREPFLSDRTCDYGGKLVVFGHTPQRSGRPLMQANKIGIDTGAAYGGPLTAVALAIDVPGVAAVYQS